jgi:hypothetical protein
MALVDIGSITATRSSSTTYTAILDDNVVKKIFYPLNIGFSVVADTLALPNETFRRLNNYIYWS